MQYRNLNEAANKIEDLCLAEGLTKVFYRKNKFHQQRQIPLIVTIEKHEFAEQYVCIGSIACSDREEARKILQQSYWSPNNEASVFLTKLGLSHTSFSEGDIIELDDGVKFLWSGLGWSLVLITNYEDHPYRKRSTDS